MEETRIIQKYYRAVLAYCCMKLSGDVQGAEDCTQEVFLALHRKFSAMRKDNVQGWLCAAADREVLAYRRRNPVHLSDEDIPEPSAPPEVWQSSPLDALGEADARLVKAYFGGEDRTALAAEYGMSVEALYQKVHRLRQKLRDHQMRGERSHEKQ